MTTESTEKLAFSVEETAKLLGLSRNSVYAALRAGEIPSIRVGARLLIPKTGLEKMLSEAGQDKVRRE